MIKINENKYIKMSWKYLCYCDGGNKYIFPIEPMANGVDILYMPQNKDLYLKIIEEIKAIPWNRNIIYVEGSYNLNGISVDEEEYAMGTIESTKGAQEFLKLDMFDPGFNLEKEKAHELWCILEKRFAENAEGQVTIQAIDIVKGSVFDKITIPTLMKSDKVELVFKGK